MAAKNTKKLMIKRTEVGYDDDDVSTAAPGDEASNKKIVGEFIREAIHEAGFTTNKKIKCDSYNNTVRVAIKDFGGKFYIQACYDFEQAGGSENEDEIEVNFFELGATSYAYETNEEYETFSEIVKSLALDLNKWVGKSKTLAKGDAKKSRAA